MGRIYHEREIPFHPIADEYPRMTDAELSDLGTDILERGLGYRITRFRGAILDGRNRFLACCRAGVELEDEDFADLPDDLTEDELRAYVVSKNEKRRHESKEAIEARRRRRNAAMAEDRRNGMSLPAIAEKHDASLGAVQRGLKAAGLSGDKADPPEGKVQGKDGKSYPASRPAPPPFDREPGDDTDAIEEERRHEKELPRPGAILFDWKAFESHYGELVRDIDKLGRAYRAKESQSARALREQLDRFHGSFKSWHKTLTGAKS